MLQIHATQKEKKTKQNTKQKTHTSGFENTFQNVIKGTKLNAVI